MQTILGAGGAIGEPLAQQLTPYTDKIRLVSRRPKNVNTTDEVVAADLLNADQVGKAVAGSSIVYLTAGLKYKTSVWQKEWPVVMQNVLDACKKHHAKLVFFDNMYMYDKNYLGNLNEDTPVVPSSKKGEVRARIADMLMKEVAAGNLQGMIVRAADFIATKNSALVEMVYNNLVKGKKANWIADVNKIHSFTFVPDAAKATAMLGNTDDAYNQVWHLPSYSSLTGKDWIEMIAKELNTRPSYSVLSVGMMSLVGLFVPILRELKEMAYQYELDYGFNSSKFQKRFEMPLTTPAEAVQWLVKELKKQNS